MIPSVRLTSLVLGPASAGLLLTVLLPHRPDRTGHFLAGFGATLIACWLAALVTKGSSLAVMGAALGCVGLGHLAEVAVFPLGGYDVLDFTSQSAGAIHAGLALVLGRAGNPDHDWFDREHLTPSPYGSQVLGAGTVAFLLGAWRAFA